MNFYSATTMSTHNWARLPGGNVDSFAWEDWDRHNQVHVLKPCHGPKCIDCGLTYCVECFPEGVPVSECPSKVRRVFLDLPPAITPETHPEHTFMEEWQVVYEGRLASGEWVERELYEPGAVEADHARESFRALGADPRPATIRNIRLLRRQVIVAPWEVVERG